MSDDHVSEGTEDDALTRTSDGGLSSDRVPLQYRDTTGSITWDRTIPQLKRFVEDGGTLLAIGDATAIAERIGVPDPAATGEETFPSAAT